MGHVIESILMVLLQCFHDKAHLHYITILIYYLNYLSLPTLIL